MRTEVFDVEYIISTTNMPDHILEVVAPWCNAEVIRCRDCKCYTDQPGISGEKPNRKYCYKYSDWDSEWDFDDYHYVEPDGFCKWGERITANGGDSEAVI